MNKTTIKRIVAILVTGALLLMCPVFNGVAYTPPEVKMYEGFRYSVYEDTLTGRQTVTVLDGYTGTPSDTIVFPSEIEGIPVDTIGQSFISVFEEELPGVTRLIIPEGVRLVGGLGLDKLPNLQEVVLPRSLKGILWECFSDCPNLSQLAVPAGVSLIGENVFHPNTTLRGETGSYIERYAAFHELAFEPIVYEVSLGDLDADGLCTTTDARLILQHTVGKAELDETFADVDGDGEVTTTDARLCLQYTVGKAELSLDVPATRLTEGLISSQAQVYVNTGKGRTPVADRSSAIRVANAIFATSYNTGDSAPKTLTKWEFHFIEPDGTRVILSLREEGLVANASGYEFAWLYTSTEVWNELISIVEVYP